MKWIETAGDTMAKEDRIELFCQAILKGQSQRQAYYTAYPAARNWKDSTVDSKASGFAKNDKVLARLEALRKEMEEENRIEKNDILAHLGRIGFADVDCGNIRPGEKIKALELMAKLLGYDQNNSTGQELGVVVIPDVQGK